MSRSDRLKALKTIIKSGQTIKNREIEEELGRQFLAEAYAKQAIPITDAFNKQTEQLGKDLKLVREEVEAVKKNTELGAPISPYYRRSGPVYDIDDEYLDSVLEETQDDTVDSLSQTTQSTNVGPNDNETIDTDDSEQIFGYFGSSIVNPQNRATDFVEAGSTSYKTNMANKDVKINYDQDNQTFEIDYYDGTDTSEHKVTPGLSFLLLSSMKFANTTPFQQMLKSDLITDEDIKEMRTIVLPRLQKGPGGATALHKVKKDLIDHVIGQKGAGLRKKYTGKAPLRLPAKQKGSGAKKKPDSIHSDSPASMKKRLEVLMGSIRGGNNNQKTVNEMLGIADTLRDHDHITRAKHKSVYKLAGIV